MRFPKDTRALIYEAGSNPVTIAWPSGEPKKGRVYWLQSEEDAREAERKAKARRENSPETHAEVMAGMHRRAYGTEPTATTKPRRRRLEPASRPSAGDDRILVIDTAILDKGWEAKVALYEDPDPIGHMRMKAKVPPGPNPLNGKHEKTELEPERLDPISTHQRRREEEETLVREHKASIDHSEAIRAEQHVANLRKRGKRSKLAEEAAKRARRRAEEAGEIASAAAAV